MLSYVFQCFPCNWRSPVVGVGITCWIPNEERAWALQAVSCWRCTLLPHGSGQNHKIILSQEAQSSSKALSLKQNPSRLGRSVKRESEARRRDVARKGVLAHVFAVLRPSRAVNAFCPVLRYGMLYYAILGYVVCYHIIVDHVIVVHIISYHIISYHIMVWFGIV